MYLLPVVSTNFWIWISCVRYSDRPSAEGCPYSSIIIRENDVPTVVASSLCNTLGARLFRTRNPCMLTHEPPIVPLAVSRYLAVPMVLAQWKPTEGPNTQVNSHMFVPQMERRAGERGGFAEGGAWTKNCQSSTLSCSRRSVRQTTPKHLPWPA